MILASVQSAADLKAYAKALATGSLLSAKTQEARFEAQPLEGEPDFVRYGEGIVQFGPFWRHNGPIIGFSSEMWYLPAKDAVVLVNVNDLT